MNSVSESIYINKDSSFILNVIKDVDKYPSVFKFYKTTHLVSFQKKKKFLK